MNISKEVLQLSEEELGSRNLELQGARIRAINGIKEIFRAIALKDGDLADSYEKLFPGQEFYFEESPLGSTKKVSGYKEKAEERDPETSPEVAAYYCPGCEGWVKGAPSKKHVLEGETTKEKIIKVQLFCTIDGQRLGVRAGSTPTR